MLKEFGVDLKYLHDKEGVHDVKFLVLQRKLRIVASPAGLQQVQEELLNIAEQLPEVGHLGEEEECCPVCLSPPEDGRRLEHCGHIYCLPCLTLQIMSSSGPLLCSQQVICKYNCLIELHPTGLQLPLCGGRLKVFWIGWEGNQDDCENGRRAKIAWIWLLLDCLSKPQLWGSLPKVLHRCRHNFLSSWFYRLEKGEELQDGEAFLCQFCGSKICRRFCVQR